MNKVTDNTKLKLALAMKECMTKASVENITVSMICNQGNFSRQTFYRAFIDKYDLINWYFDRILNESFEKMGQGRTIKDGLIKKFKYIRQEYVFFKTGFAYDKQNNLKQHDFDMIFAFYKNLIYQKSGQEINNIMSDLLEMYCQSSIYMTVKWIEKGMDKSEEELADIMILAMPEELSDLFKKLEILA